MENKVVNITITGIDRLVYGDLRAFAILNEIKLSTKVEDAETDTYTVVLSDADIWCSIARGGVFDIRKGLSGQRIPFNRIGELIVC